MSSQDERKADVQLVACLSQPGLKRGYYCYSCLDDLPLQCGFKDVRRLAARKAKDTTLVPAGFVRLVNITDGAKRQGTAVSKAILTQSDARTILAHLQGPMATFLQHEKDNLSTHGGAMVIWRKEVREGADTCDKCCNHIYNLHWFCTDCAKIRCMECPFNPRDKCAANRVGKRRRHEPECAVLHSGIEELNEFITLSQTVCENEKIERARIVLDSEWEDFRTGVPIVPGIDSNHRRLSPFLTAIPEDDRNEPIFEHLMTIGQPFIVPVKLKEGDHDFWNPQSLSHYFRDMRGVVTFQHQFEYVDGDRRNATQEMDMGAFFSSLEIPTDKTQARKLCDFPEQGPGLSMMVPEVLHHFNELLPYQKYMHETGPMNMVSALDWRAQPDVTAKFYSGHGSVDADPTPLHTDIADSVNICMWVGGPCQVQNVSQLGDVLPEDHVEANVMGVGAIWHIFRREDYDVINQYVQTRDGLGTLDVIQDKSVFLRRADFVALSVQNVRPVTVLQRAGDVVVVPGCLPHQVININNTIKMARDFVSPFNVVHFQRNLQQIHELEKREDYIGVWRAISLSYTRALKTVQGHSFESKQPIAEKKTSSLSTENYKLRQASRNLESENAQLKSDNAKLQGEVEELKGQFDAFKAKHSSCALSTKKTPEKTPNEIRPRSSARKRPIEPIKDTKKCKLRLDTVLTRLEHEGRKVKRPRQPIESSTIDLTAESDEEDSLAAQGMTTETITAATTSKSEASTAAASTTAASVATAAKSAAPSSTESATASTSRATTTAAATSTTITITQDQAASTTIVRIPANTSMPQNPSNYTIISPIVMNDDGDDFVRHGPRRIVDNTNIWYCWICRTPHSSEAIYREHLKIHNVRCPRCDKLLANQRSLRTHLKKKIPCSKKVKSKK